MDVLLNDLRENYVHTKDSNRVHRHLEELLNTGRLRINNHPNENDSTISTLKYVARKHGLPVTFGPVLFSLLRPTSNATPTPQIQYKTALTLKYSVFHNPVTFTTLSPLLELLDQRFPVGQLEQPEKFKTEIITELLKTVHHILSSDRIKNEGIEEERLWRIERYLPYVRSEFKTDLGRSLSRVGYFSGNVNSRRTPGQYHRFHQNEGENASFQTGDQILAQIPERRGWNVESHQVMSQQMDALTVEENLSEKTEMSNIALANALDFGRERQVETERIRETLPDPRQTDESRKNWYHSTLVETKKFLEVAEAEQPISFMDIAYLLEKFCGDEKWSFGLSTAYRMDLRISKTFVLISNYQELTDQVLEKLLTSSRIKHPDIRLNIVKACDCHCNRRTMVPREIAITLRGMYQAEEDGKAIKDKIWEILTSDESESQTTENLTIAVQNLTKEDLVDSSLSFIFRSLLKPHIGEILSSSSSAMENFLPNLIHRGILQFQKQKAVDVLEEFLRLNSTTRGLDPPTFSEIAAAALNQSNLSSTIRVGLVRCILRSLEKSSINEPNYFQQFSMDQLNYIFQKICGVITLKRDNPFEPRVKILVMALLCKLLENDNVALKQCLIAQIASKDQMSYLMDQLCLHQAVMFEDGSVVNDYDPRLNNDPEAENQENIENQNPETRRKSHNYVSTFAATLIHSVLIENGSRACNEIIISALSQALLQSDSKLTKIICSEALFFASVETKVVFSAPVLNLIQPLTYSPISDVRIYITCAYCNSLANQSGVGLEPQHVNSLVDLYALKRVILAKIDYTDFINPLILQVFLEACRVGIGISEACFGLLALVLNRANIESSTSSDYQTVKSVIQLITWYCLDWDHPADLPQIVLVSVENLFLKSHYFTELCAAILEKCLSMGRHISVEVINKFATYLTTEEPRVSLPFLKRLALANEHQELPDGAFELFEMEILAVRLSPPGMIDGGKRQILLFQQSTYKKPETLSYFIEMARNGKTLSKLGQAVIHHHLREWPEENKNLILCLSMVASNGQSLPEEIIQSALQISCGDNATANMFEKLNFAQVVVKMSATLLLPEQFQAYLFNTLTLDNDPVDTTQTLRKVIDVVRTMIQYNKLLPLDVASAYCQQLRNLIKSTTATTMTPENLKSLIRLLKSGAFEGMQNENVEMALEACREMFLDAALSQDVTLVEVGREGVTLLDGDVVIPGVGLARFWETLRVTVELSREGGGDDDDVLRFSVEEMKAILPDDITLLRQVGQLLADRGGDGEAMTSIEKQIFEVICDLFKTARENLNRNDFAQEADKVLENILEAWRVNLDHKRLVTLAVSAGCRDSGSRDDDEVSGMECALKDFKENPIYEVYRSSLETLFGNEDLVKPTIKKIVETMSSLDVDVSHWKSLKNVVHPVAAWILSGNLEIDVTNKNQWGSEIETFVEILEDEILHGQSCPIPVTILRAYERIMRVVSPNARSSNSKNANACVTHLASILDFEGPHRDMVKFLICRIFETFIQTHDQIPETLLRVTLDCATQSGDNLLRAASVSNLLLIREKCERRGQSQAPRITTQNAHQSEYDSDADSNSDDGEVDPDIIRPFQRVAQRIVTNSLEQRLSPEAVTREMKLVKLIFSLNHIDKSVIKEKPKDEWPLQLMISDTISTLAKTDDQKMHLFPVAKELCNILVEQPLLRLCVVQRVKNFVADNHGEMEIARILDFVNMSLRVQNPPPAEPWNPEWLKNLILDGLTSKLLEKMGEEFQPQEMIDRAMKLPNPLPLGFLDEIISSIKNPSIPPNREKQERRRNRAQMRKLLEVVKLKIIGQQEQVELFRSRLEGHSEDGLTLAEMLLRFQTAQQTSVFQSEMETSTFVAAQVTRIEELTECLISKNYSIQHIQKLFAKAKQYGERSMNISEVLESLENVLYLIVAYEGSNLGPNNFPYIVGQLVETNVRDWVSRCNEMVLALVISVDRGEKSAQTIAEEFRDLNGANEYGAFLENFAQRVARIQEGEAVTTFQNLDITTNPIKQWTLQDISKWAKQIRSRNLIECELTQGVIQEAVTVISRACRLQWNYSLSPIQILALFAYFKDRRGKLLQVVTGSGKSTIIASIAVMWCLLGRKVDIYTSSPVLAERDSRVWQPFYHIFGLTCAHNGDSSGTGYVGGSKSCYKKDVVYGDTAQFQFDTLRDEFSCLKTRAKRPYEIAIVDEVDYMFVDDSSKLARLASTLPGMDMLGTLYHMIWHRLHDIKERLYGVGDFRYYLEGERRWDEINGNLVYRFADPSGSIKAIRDLPGYIRSHENDEEVLEQSLIFKVDDVDSFVVDHLQKYTRALIGDESFSENRNLVQKLPLPKHLLKFARFQVGHWVSSAITALLFTPGIHYIIDQDQIKPVEYKSSGVIQNLTRWCNGLHQFLQLKHGLRLTVETVTTNFMSNISMFRKYNGNIVGFTGTLGTDFGRRVLQDVYNVDALIIPELHRKRYYQLPDTVTPNVINWRDSIIRSALHEASSFKRRAVLVICETIKDAEMIARGLQMTETSGINVKCYTRNDQNQEGQVEQVRPGDIIVATNLAGRGTDIKAAMVEQFGGIHVILTYLPTSLRVELQAFGRTSRQGNSGTGQLILHMDCGTSGSAEELKSQRNTREDKGLSRFQTEHFPIIETKDRLFQKFSKVYSNIRKDLTKNSLIKYKMQAITGIELAILLALEEQWAIFLKKVDDKIIDLERSDEVYQELENDILAAYYSEENSRDVMTPTDNCFYWINQGNEYYVRWNTLKDYTGKALECFQKAVEMDPEFCAGAHAGLGYALLRGKTRWFRSYLHGQDYKEKALEHLRTAMEILSLEKGVQESLGTLMLHRQGNTTSELFKQITERVNLIGDYCRNLEEAMNCVERTFRRVYCKETVLGVGTNSYELDYKEPLTSFSRRNNVPTTTRYQLTFNDLTVRSDMGTQDQAVETIRNERMVSLQVSNQDLEQLAKDVEQYTERVFAAVEFHDIENFEKVKRLKDSIVERFDHWSLKLFGKRRDFVEKVLEVSFNDSSRPGENVFVSWQDGNSTTTHRRKVTEMSDLPYQTEDSLLFDVDVEVTAEDFDLSRLNNLLSETSNFGFLLYNLSSYRTKKFWGTADDPGILQEYHRHNQVTLSQLPKDNALMVVKILREKKISFCLVFDHLSYAEAEKILKKCSRKQEDIEEMKHLKKLGHQFLSSSYVPLDVIHELTSRGLELMPGFSERQFVPWRTMATLGVIASVQMTAGTILVVTGVGSPWGVALITEGMADLVIAQQAYVHRDFNWKHYGVRKAVSLTVSAVTVGMSTLSKGGQGIKQIAEGAASEVAEQGATSVVVKGGEEVLKSATRKNVEVALKCIGLQGVEAAKTVGLRTIDDVRAEFNFEDVRENIIRRVQMVVLDGLGDAENVRKMGQCFAVGKSDRILLDKADGWLGEVTNPQSSFWSEAWHRVVVPLCIGIFSNEKFFGSNFKLLGVILGGDGNSVNIQEVTKNVCQHIASKLEAEARIHTPAYAIQSHFGVTQRQALDIVQRMTIAQDDFRVLRYPEEAHFPPSGNVKLSELRKLFDNIHQQIDGFSIHTELASRLMMIIINGVTDQIISESNRHLASPTATFAMGTILNRNTETLLRNFLVGDSQLTEIHRRIRELRGRDPASLTLEERNFLRTHDNPNQGSGGISEIPSQNLLQLREVGVTLQNILNGGPADTAVILLLMRLNRLKNVRLVLDDPDLNYVPTPTEIGQNVKIVIKISSSEYIVKDTGSGAVETVTGVDGVEGEDAGYKMLSLITGGRAQRDLRNQAATYILQNPEKFARIYSESARWLGGIASGIRIRQVNEILTTSGNYLRSGEKISLGSLSRAAGDSGERDFGLMGNPLRVDVNLFDNREELRVKVSASGLTIELTSDLEVGDSGNTAAVEPSTSATTSLSSPSTRPENYDSDVNASNDGMSANSQCCIV